MSMFSEYCNVNEIDISFNMKDVDLSVINSLRRIIISEIPNVGFLFDPSNVTKEQDIDVKENDSALHNELIQQRFSLIPIHVNIDELENWDEKKYSFVLSKNNTSTQMINVLSSDIQVFNENDVFEEAITKRYFPPDPITKDYILITKLKPSSRANINIKAKAVTHTANAFTSFGIVSTCSVEHIVDDEFAKKSLKKYLENNVNKDSVENLTYQFNSIEKERCYHRNKYREPNYFRFHIVSESSIQSSYIFKKALEVLKNKFIKLQDLEFETLQNENLYSVIIKNECHTLGNVFQSLCFNKFIREAQEENKKDSFGLKYIGYNVPHPLESILVIKIKGDQINSIKDIKIFVSQACEFIIEYLTVLEEKWNVFYK